MSLFFEKRAVDEFSEILDARLMGNDCNELENRAEAADFYSVESISLTRERLRALSFFYQRAS